MTEFGSLLNNLPRLDLDLSALANTHPRFIWLKISVKSRIPRNSALQYDYPGGGRISGYPTP